MKRSRIHRTLTVLVGTAALATALPTAAHHSFAAYENTKTVTLNGTVKTFQWSNPHVIFGVLVQAEDQTAPREWNIVTSGPTVLTRFGWNRNSIKPGDRISLEPK